MIDSPIWAEHVGLIIEVHYHPYRQNVSRWKIITPDGNNHVGTFLLGKDRMADVLTYRILKVDKYNRYDVEDFVLAYFHTRRNDLIHTGENDNDVIVMVVDNNGICRFNENVRSQ